MRFIRDKSPLASSNTVQRLSENRKYLFSSERLGNGLNSRKYNRTTLPFVDYEVTELYYILYKPPVNKGNAMSLLSEFKKVSAKTDLKLLYSKVLMFQKPQFERAGARIKEITAEIVKITEPLLLNRVFRFGPELQRKTNSLRDVYSDSDLTEEDLRTIMNVWVSILHEECRRLWNVSSTQMIKEKVEQILVALR